MEKDDSFASDGEDYKEEEENGEESEASSTNPQDSHTTKHLTVEDITSDVSNMSVAKPQQKFSMDIQFPFIVYDYVSDDRCHASVDFLLYAVSKEMIPLKMTAIGSELHLDMVIPTFFAETNRLM
jgi:hypothetical protein